MKNLWQKFNIKISEKDFTIVGLWWAMTWRMMVLYFIAAVIVAVLEKLF